MMYLRSSLTTTLLAAALTCAAPLRAEEAPHPPVPLSALMTNCPSMVAALTSAPGMVAALQARPIEAAKVCSCTERHVAADRRLAPFLADSLSFQDKMSSEKFKSYFFLRVMNGVLQCLAPELEASLSAVTF